MWPQHESHPKVMEAVLARCTDPVALVNHPDVDGVTPLHICTDVILP